MEVGERFVGGEAAPPIERKYSDAAPGSAPADFVDPGVPDAPNKPVEVVEPGHGVEEEERYDQLLDMVSDDEADNPDARRAAPRPAGARRAPSRGSEAAFPAGSLKQLDMIDAPSSSPHSIPNAGSPLVVEAAGPVESEFDAQRFRKSSLARLEREKWWSELPPAQQAAVLQKQEADERKRVLERQRQEEELRAQQAERARLEEESKRIRSEVEGGAMQDHKTPRSPTTERARLASDGKAAESSSPRAPVTSQRAVSGTSSHGVAPPHSEPALARTTTPAALSHPASLVAQSSAGRLPGLNAPAAAVSAPVSAKAKAPAPAPEPAKGCCVVM